MVFSAPDQTKAPEQILKIENLSISFGEGKNEIQAVRGINIEIGRGETVALVGESGSGKTVTALAVTQLLPYPTAKHPSGSIKFNGKELMGTTEENLQKIRGDRIGMIFQEPMTSLNPLHTLEKQIGEVLLLHKGLNKANAQEQILDLLQQVGLPNAKNLMQSFPHQLSGGQRQRAMIAMSLANDPDLLIADEPTTALDVTVQAQILALLKSLQISRQMSVLLITHDLSIVRKFANNVYVMTNGRIVEKGLTPLIFKNPQHSYTQHLLESEPKGKKSPVSQNSRIVLKSENLKIWFPIRRGVLRRLTGYVKAVDGVSIQIREGHTLGIVGESGSGKTTLALGLLRLEKSQGSIVFLGDHLEDKKWKALRPLRKEMQIVFQDPYGSLSPRMSVSQIIEEGLLIHQSSLEDKARRKIITDTLAEVGLESTILDRYPHEFSGGQRQRIAIARAMVLKPRLVVLDEPTSALDMSVQAQIVELLRDLQKKYKLAYLFISHDLRVVRALADEIIVMRNGKVVEQGLATSIFENPKESYTQALIKAAFEIEAVNGGEISSD
ncbi:MAG: ABC transporter ATP-binding protein [Pseudomonadota bacterium]|nr:ABC transporter ATP-binding protein [Pseudomonadota bacterium]